MSKYLTAFTPDKAALAALGETVRERLEADPGIHCITKQRAELYVCGDFLDSHECEKLMEMIDQTARPSTLFKETMREGYRTSYSGDMDQGASMTRMFDRRVSDLLGIDDTWGERAQGQRYDPGQQYKQHCDFFHTDSGYWKKEEKRGGQRSWTAMAYLNDVEEGGETEFPLLELSVTPKQGALLIWNNAHPDGSPNKNTLHAALPVIRGRKYVVTKWFRTRMWN